MTDIPADADESEMELYLATADGLETVTVEREGSCASYIWTLRWPLSPGDQSQISKVDTYIPFTDFMKKG